MIDATIVRFNDSEEADFFRTAIHEGGHNLVAFRLGLDPVATVTGLRSGLNRCRRGTPLQCAAVGWAGIVAEALFKLDDRTKPPPPNDVPFEREWLFLWHDSFVRGAHLDAMSPGDRQSIKADGRSLDSLRLAFEILAPNKPIVEFLAKRLMEDCRATVSVTRHDPAFAELETQRFLERTRVR